MADVLYNAHFIKIFYANILFPTGLYLPNFNRIAEPATYGKPCTVQFVTSRFTGLGIPLSKSKIAPVGSQFLRWR